MKIFIDSADIEEIRQAYEWGIADGITTNPSLLKKALTKHKKKNPKLDLKQYLSQILKIAKGTPVSLEITELSKEGMIWQAKKLYSLFNPVAKNVVIKIPINPALKDKDATHFDGIRVIKELSSANIPTNCTLVFTPEQALLAAKAGATFVSPFAGRIDDYIRTQNKIKFQKTDHYPVWGSQKRNKTLHDNGIVSGIDLVEQCVTILHNYNLKTQVLAASLRNTRQVREAAMVGSQVATLPFSVIKEMLKHQKTYEGMKSFTKDAPKEYVELMK